MKEATANTITNTIIQFPKGRIIRTPIPATLKDNINKTKKNYINKMIEESASNLAKYLSMSGINITSEEFQKNYALSIECLRSTVYKTFDLTHPLQQPMKNMIDSLEDIIAERKK